jgi:hypothetical protein
MEFLNQMKIISERADLSFEREEKLNGQIRKLQGEVQEWKSRYAKAKTTIRSIRSSSLGLQVPTSGMLFGKEGNLVDVRGLIKAVHLTKFQIAIDELLKVARGINFYQSLEKVKAVVLATRALTQDINGNNNDSIARLKARISATANNLTTAAKNHATGAGLSPVSLLDAAASHLTSSVIELVKLVRIRPTQEGDSDEEEEGYNATAIIEEEGEVPFSPDDDENRYVPVGAANDSKFEENHVNGNGHHHVPELDVNGAGNRLSNDSMYSPLSSPSAPRSAPRSRDGSAMMGEMMGTESKNWGGLGSAPDFGGVSTSGSDVEELRVCAHDFPMPPSRSGHRTIVEQHIV